MAASRLTTAIKALGMSPSQFCQEKLGIKYGTFNYRIREGRLTLDDYHTILLATGKTFEQLFPNPNASARIPEAQTIPRRQAFKVTTVADMNPEQVEEGKKMFDAPQQPLTHEDEVKFDGSVIPNPWNQLHEYMIPEPHPALPQKKEEAVTPPPLTKPNGGFKARSINLLAVPEPVKDEDQLPQWQAVPDPLKT